MNRYSSRKQFGYIKYIKHLKSEHLSIQNQLTVPLKLSMPLLLSNLFKTQHNKTHTFQSSIYNLSHVLTNPYKKH